MVRYWKDVAGEEKRQRVYAKICPISGPGKLSASERERKVKEIVAASGVDTQEFFDKVVKQSAPGVTFRQQAETWLEDMRNRDSDPLAPSTGVGEGWLRCCVQRYDIHVERSGTHGQDLDDWLQAERELEAKYRAG